MDNRETLSDKGMEGVKGARRGNEVLLGDDMVLVKPVKGID